MWSFDGSGFPSAGDGSQCLSPTPSYNSFFGTEGRSLSLVSNRLAKHRTSRLLPCSAWSGARGNTPHRRLKLRGSAMPNLGDLPAAFGVTRHSWARGLLTHQCHHEGRTGDLRPHPTANIATSRRGESSWRSQLERTGRCIPSMSMVRHRSFGCCATCSVWPVRSLDAALCGVHIDGVATRSCVTPIDSIGTSEITTIEAIGATVVGLH